MPLDELRTCAVNELGLDRCQLARQRPDGSVVAVPMPRVMLATQLDSQYWVRERQPRMQIGRKIIVAYAGVACRPTARRRRGIPFTLKLCPSGRGRCVVRVEFKVFSFWRNDGNVSNWWNGDVNLRGFTRQAFSG